ncbi:MAG: hypothetical protein PVF15_11080 [Candidatus Bathyarchaeota archaeon]|jgi:hypothetical protein
MRVVKGYKLLAEKTVSIYEDWAAKCLTKARKLHGTGNRNDALHFEVEADYWFNMAEKLAKDSNFLACLNCGTVIYKDKDL